MISFSKQADRLGKATCTLVLAAVVAGLAVGLTVAPALADDYNRERREQQWRYEQQENERRWRENQRRHRRYVAPPGHPYYAPPPPVYYYPQPMAPSFSVIIPFGVR
jgi:hypothetical protein